MPSIVITEQDLTAAVSDANNEIVYVPGFSNITYSHTFYGKEKATILNVRYINNKSGRKPYASLQATFDTDNVSNDLYTNIADKKTWRAVKPSSSSGHQDCTYNSAEGTTYTIENIDSETNEQLVSSITSVTYNTTLSGVSTETILPVSNYKVTEQYDEDRNLVNFVLELIGDLPAEFVNDFPFVVNYEMSQWKELKDTADGTLYDSIYVDPHVNTPTLCNSTSQFESMFGNTPKTFSTPTTIDVKPIGENTTTYKYTFDTVDNSYYYAKDIIKAGLPVYYESVAIFAHDNDTTDSGKVDFGLCDVTKLNPTDVYKYILIASEDSTGSWIMDKSEYNIKYITTGAYPSFEYDYDDAGSATGTALSEALLDLAGPTENGRGDCVALIDHFDIPQRPLNPMNDNSIYKSVNSWIGGESNIENVEYGAMFTPYAKYSSDSANADILFPASYGFLLALAKSVKTNPTWLAIAGLNRGRVPRIRSLDTFDRLSNKIADDYEKRTGVAINAITNIKGYGLTIWGNRSLLRNVEDLTATSFLNIRSMLCDVKKTVYNAAKSCIFEQNSDVLWINFKSKITPLLDKMKSGQGIKDYKIVKVDTDVKAKLKAKILITPIYALEDIEVAIQLVDDIVTVD